MHALVNKRPGLSSCSHLLSFNCIANCASIILGPEPSVVGLMIVSFVLGVYVARFNILAATVASIVCAAVALLYDLSSESTLMHSLLASVGTACALQVGYLVGQLLRLPRR
jgi:hypothetical protein